MPIEHGVQAKLISEDEFHTLDYKVMGLAFSVQRNLSRFWNEKIYQNELAYRCQEAGFENVATEVPIQVSFKDFSNIDLLINNAVIYKFKAVKALTGEHRKQALNYLCLLGLQRGKLINVRPSSGEHFLT